MSDSVPNSIYDFDPSTPSATREVLHAIGASPNRVLGQNFLTNKSALDRIIALAQIREGEHVLEIGPGLGSLTRRLLMELHDSGGHLSAVEKDPTLFTYLQNQWAGAPLHLVTGDALRVEWSTLSLPENGVKLVANLPYSISKPFLRRVYEVWRPHLTTATLMLQREVADRLTAAPGTRAYGPMAIMAQLHSRTRRAFILAPGSFWPPPEVSSAVVQIELLESPSIELEDETFFWSVVRAAFAQRRKQLINTLRPIAEREVLSAALEAVEIDSQRRGETLSLEEFSRLSSVLLNPKPETPN